MSLLQHVVLASASPRRLELLRSLNLDVTVIPSAYDEPEHPGMTPRELAIVHARNKAADVRASIQTSERVIVAADTVVDLHGTVYGKPRDAAEAKRMLRELSGRTHTVHTAYAYVALDELHEDCVSSDVTFFALDDDEIATYVASGEPMDKAGAYGIQGYGATLVERIDGDFYTVMGFPLARFVRSLRRLGFALPIANTASSSS